MSSKVEEQTRLVDMMHDWLFLEVWKEHIKEMKEKNNVASSGPESNHFKLYTWATVSY